MQNSTLDQEDIPTNSDCGLYYAILVVSRRLNCATVSSRWFEFHEWRNFSYFPGECNKWRCAVFYLLCSIVFWPSFHPPSAKRIYCTTTIHLLPSLWRTLATNLFLPKRFLSNAVKSSSPFVSFAMIDRTLVVFSFNSPKVKVEALQSLKNGTISCPFALFWNCLLTNKDFVN